MNKIIKVGVIGTANIATRSVMPTILEMPACFKLKGIASRSIEKAQKCALKFKTKAFGSYQELIEYPEIDAVYIPLPNSLHAEWIEKAINNDLHVLVEKSLACTHAEVIRLNRLAKEKGVLLIENFQFRFHSQLAYIQKLIANGVIGEIRSFRSSFGFPGLPSENDIRYQQELGGGALLDTGAYPLKIAQIFLGKDIEVASANLNSLEDKDVDIWGGAYVKQRSGPLFGELAFGFNHYYQCNVEIWGSKGKISANRIFTAKKNYSPVIEIENQEGIEKIVLKADDHFKNMLLHFYNLIVKDKHLIEEEYIQNINQSRLIDEVKIRANE